MTESEKVEFLVRSFRRALDEFSSPYNEGKEWIVLVTKIKDRLDGSLRVIDKYREIPRKNIPVKSWTCTRVAARKIQNKLSPRCGEFTMCPEVFDMLNHAPCNSCKYGVEKIW